MAPVSVTQQARLLVGLAIAGAVPLTVGALLWLVGAAMGAAYHGHWSATAGLGEVLLAAGLICGLGVFLLAVVGERWTPPGRPAPASGGEPDLMPLASPEHQAFLAGPPPPASPSPPAPPQFPPEQHWPDPEPAPPAYPTFPGPGSGG
jgi:hypothetical protein